jgi:choline dehydrogenase
MEDILADFVVVGGGTAGCVVAARLAEYGFETLLLSSGSNDTSNPLMIQKSLFVPLLQTPHFKHHLPHTPLPNLNNRTLDLVVWNSLGGNSINWGGLERMTEAECDLFVNASGDRSFCFESMSTYYKMVENFTTTAPSPVPGIHGNNGPIKITHVDEPVFNDVWKKVAHELCETFSDDLAGAVGYGFSFEPSSFKNGRRSWSANEYLIPALNKYQNLTVITGATVTKFDVNAVTKRVDSLLFVSSNGYFRAVARKEYILSAGTFFSPHLLMLSGIGDPEILEQNDIPVKHVLKQVGKNLTDNGSIVMEYETKDLATGQCIPAALVNGQAQTTKTNPDLFFVLKMYHATGRLYVPIFNASPRSPTGSISLYNSNPLVPPKVTLNYLDDPKDIETFIDGINYVRRVMSTNTIKQFAQVVEISPGIQETNLNMYIRNTLLPAYHFISTCSMGQDAQTSVVDKDFKIHGLDNLRVVDASVFPADFGVKSGPCLTVYALAEKAADVLKQEYS